MITRRAHILPYPVVMVLLAVSVGVVGWADTPRPTAVGLAMFGATLAVLAVDAWWLRRGWWALFFGAVAGANLGAALGILARFG
jgi:hypothetical protein